MNANIKEWSFSQERIGAEQDFTLLNKGGPRRIQKNFPNARVGDIVIGYETSPKRKVVALCTVSRASDGKKIYFRKEEHLKYPITLKEIKAVPELKNMEVLVKPRGTFYKLTQAEFDTIISMLQQRGNQIDLSKLQPQRVTPYTKEDFLKEVYMSRAEYDDIVDVLKSKKNIILQGAPGVGKTFAAKRLAYSLIRAQDNSRVKMVQFHQNCTYEDFFIGYKPTENGFKLQQGIFYNFCKDAEKNPDKDHFLIIDEINRGNLSKIFGELLMLIESDYRGPAENGVCLAYNGEKFAIPQNLYIIGLMNTSDRSLQIMDYALRRRFCFINILPGFDTVGFKGYQSGLRNKKFDKLVTTIKGLNKEISEDVELGPGFCIGHSYLCGMTAADCTDDRLRRIIKYDLIPTLKEYWRLNDDALETWTRRLNSIVS